MEIFENHMVVDWVWESFEKHEKGEDMEALNGPGFREIGTEIFVPEKDTYQYAIERVHQDKELQKEFVDWFYSADWIKED